MSYALGGPNQYTGRSMRAAHVGLGITAVQFGAVAGHLDASLASFDVPRLLIDEVIAKSQPSWATSSKPDRWSVTCRRLLRDRRAFGLDRGPAAC